MPNDHSLCGAADLTPAAKSGRIFAARGALRNGRTVWVTKSGKKYHNNPNCSKMSSPIEMDLLEAIEKGYEPCGKCYK